MDPIVEELKVSGSQLVDTVKQLVHEGNVRRILIKQEGKTVLELPLTAVAIGMFIAPVLAAIGAFAAIATDCTIVVEREAQPPKTGEEKQPWAAPSFRTGGSESLTGWVHL